MVQSEYLTTSDHKTESTAPCMTFSPGFTEFDFNFLFWFFLSLQTRSLCCDNLNLTSHRTVKFEHFYSSSFTRRNAARSILWTLHKVSQSRKAFHCGSYVFWWQHKQSAEICCLDQGVLFVIDSATGWNFPNILHSMWNWLSYNQVTYPCSHNCAPVCSPSC